MRDDHPRDALLYRILEAIAEEEDREVMDLPALEAVVDTDALLTVLESGDDVVVSFDFEGDRVRVHGDGRVTIE